jgi:hypothetical protein
LRTDALEEIRAAAALTADRVVAYVAHRQVISDN